MFWLYIAGTIVGTLVTAALILLAFGAYLDHKDTKIEKKRRHDRLVEWKKVWNEAPEWIIVTNAVTGEAQVKRKRGFIGYDGAEVTYAGGSIYSSVEEAQVSIITYLKNTAREEAVRAAWLSPKRAVEIYLQSAGTWTIKRLDNA